jgi:hypothetical protein
MQSALDGKNRLKTDLQSRCKVSKKSLRLNNKCWKKTISAIEKNESIWTDLTQKKTKRAQKP